MNNHTSPWRLIKRGVRQGCILSPDLFNLYSEIILRCIQGLEGIKIGGVNINNVRYADDTVLIADSEEKLKNLIDAVQEASEAKGLRLNIKKTEVMVVSKQPNPPRCNITINNETLKQVEQFKYLGSILTQDSRCNQEIKTRIAIAKQAFSKMKNFLTNLHISLHSRIRAMKTFIWSTLTYGCETWTISKESKKKIEAAEMWFYRRMLRIPWTARKTNIEVLNLANTTRELTQKIRKRQLSFLGHIIRRQSIEHLALTGKIDGRRARGRQRLKYLDTIVEDRGSQKRKTSEAHPVGI